MNYTVLVSSPYTSLIETVKRYFYTAGYKEQFSLIGVKTKDETLGILKNNAVSLLILDEEISSIVELLEYIRKIPLFGNKPVILLRSFGNIQIPSDISDFVYKPINGNEIVKKSTQVMDKFYEQNRLIDEIFSQTKEHKKMVSKIQSEHIQQMNLIKDRMLLIFTHELKTPLNAIINFSSYISRGLQKNTSPKRIEKYIELSKLLEANAKVLLGEINTLLDIAKIKENKLIFNPVSLNLKEIVDDLMKNYELLYKKRVSSSLEDVVMEGDRRSFMHIFENLFSNALKYAFSKVEVCLSQDSDSFYMIVEDDGAGIKEDQKSKVFELFEQSEQTVLNRQKEGTGIGLYIVKILCEHFNYKIELSDSPLGGARFCISGKK